MSSKSRRRLSVREHAAWIESGRPTERAAVEKLLDEIFFSETDRHENREHSTFQPIRENAFPT